MYENGELIVFASDSAIQTRLALISGTRNKGVVVTVTIAVECAAVVVAVGQHIQIPQHALNSL